MYWSSATPLAMEIDDRIALPLTIELISDPKAEPQVRPCPAPAIQRRGLAWPAAVAAPFNVPRLAVTLPARLLHRRAQRRVEHPERRDRGRLIRRRGGAARQRQRRRRLDRDLMRSVDAGLIDAGVVGQRHRPSVRGRVGRPLRGLSRRPRRPIPSGAPTRRTDFSDVEPLAVIAAR